MKHQKQINKLILKALKEDIGSGDITTIATISRNQRGTASIIAKENGIISGVKVAKSVFKLLDKKNKISELKKDGDVVKKNEIILKISGKIASILSAERTALNFLQRMSGIATLSGKFSNEVKNTKAKIIDTRKTAPGLRLLDKMAVESGGGQNHRLGLYDMFLIKDNHIASSGSISRAVNECKKFMKKKKIKYKIEVETENLNQVKEAVASGADIIMLDNFEIPDMKKAVELINGKAKIEVSGGVILEKVKEIAETGVDFISVGSLTHSVKALDISLEITTGLNK